MCVRGYHRIFISHCINVVSELVSLPWRKQPRPEKLRMRRTSQFQSSGKSVVKKADDRISVNLV